jgi:hypothetical protein
MHSSHAFLLTIVLFGVDITAQELGELGVLARIIEVRKESFFAVL